MKKWTLLVGVVLLGLMVAPAAAGILYWDPDDDDTAGDGDWDTTSLMWDDGAGATTPNWAWVNAVPDDAYFRGITVDTVDHTVTVKAAIDGGELRMLGTGPGETYTFAQGTGGSLDFDTISRHHNGPERFRDHLRR